MVRSGRARLGLWLLGQVQDRRRGDRIGHTQDRAGPGHRLS